MAVISGDRLLTIDPPNQHNKMISYISDLVDEKKRRVIEIIPYEEFLICFLERRNRNHVCIVYSLEKYLKFVFICYTEFKDVKPLKLKN